MSATELLLFLTYLLSVCGSDDRFAYQDSPICASNDLKVSFGTPTSTFECENENVFQTKYQKHDLNNDALPRVQSSCIRNMCKHRYNLSAQQSASFTCPPTGSIPSSCKRIFCTKDKYIKTVMPYMASKYGITDSKAYKEVLSTIYNFFRGDMNRIIIVLAHSIFTTSGFTQLVNVNTIHDKYGCKGILQFYGESNYKLASENFDFVKYPSEMAVLGTRSTIGTLQGYCKINPDDISNYFFESLVGLNPGEVQIMNLKKESTRLKITERVRVLNELKNLFNVEILFAKSGKHIPVEIQRILQDMPELIFNTKLNSADTIILMLFVCNNKNKKNSPQMDNLIGNKPPLSKCSYYRYQIKNLEVLYIRDTNAKRTYVAMAVDCGSKYDTKPGLAHLLEHLLFISPEQEQANDLGIGLDSLTCPIKDNTQQDIADSDVLKAPSQDDGEGCTKEDLDVAKLVCDALNNRGDSSQDTDSAPPKINDFDSFLNIYNGDSNAYTTEDETVYHYELDTAGIRQSFRLFANFFKHPSINEQTIMTESRVVDSEFQNRKYDDESRINRILEISVGKQFSTGSLKSFGCNYQELKKHCVDLYTTKYRRMVLVVCSAGENEEMKKIIEENFSLDLDKLVYMDRKCLICSGKEECEVTNNSETKHKAEDGNMNDHAPGRKDVSSEVSQSVPCDGLCTSKDMGQKFDSNLRITKLYKYKPIFPKKRVIVSISLPSELVQYHNMYDSLVYFFSKEDHSSLLYTLRKDQLIFNGTVNTITTQRETMLCFDFIVPSTDVYNVITDEISRYFQIYKDTQSMTSYYSKIERDVNWQLYEDEDMRIHVVDCAEKILRSKVLFTDLMFEHECKNLVMEECTVILVDDKYECEKVADDEYELCYEKIECAEEFGRRLKGDMSSEADLVDNDNGNHKKDVAMCADEINANQHTETEKGVVDPHHNRVTQKKEKFDRNNRRFGIKNIVGSVIKDKDINTILKIIKCGESRLVFIKDSFTSSKTVIHLFLRYRTSILDVINLAELVGQMNVLYNHILRSNAIAITHHICHNGILFEISGLNPFFVLINILNFEGILGMMSSKIDKLNVLNDVKVSLEDEMYESGYKRTSNSIKNVYIEGYQTIEKEYEIVKEMIEQLSIQENTDENGVADEMRCGGGISACKAGTGGEINRFIPFNEAQSVLLIVNGYSNEECYHEMFRKICARMQGKGPALEIGIRKEYGSTKDVFSVLQGENKRTDCNMVGEKKDLYHINSPKCINDILAKYRSKSDCLVFNKMINARMTIKARNNSNSVFFRIGEGIKSLAICKILVHLMNEKFFTSLRTEQSLGYVVYCSYKSIKNMHFLFFSVQSDQDVLFNIFEFIEDFDIRLECFESLKNEIMEKMKSRAQVTKHYFNIFYCSFDNVDTFRHDVCNCIDSVTVDDLKRALKEGELCVIKAEEYQESES